jgi:penicillin-binding protein 1A
MSGPPPDRSRAGQPRTAAAAAALLRAIAVDAGAAARHLRRRAPAAWASTRAFGRRAASGGRRAADSARAFLRPLGVVRTFVLLVLLGVALFAGLLAWALHDLPYASVLDEPAGEPTIMLEAANGDILARKGPFKAADVTREDLPDHLVDAVLSIEDRRFYIHRGIDPRGILRAMRRNFDAGGVVQGGSTITQQYVKIVHLSRERSLKRKIREAALSVWLDAQLGKDAILTRYLNNVYLGAGATGVAAAARVYFDKAVSELSLAESAMIAGLIKAPSQYSPFNDEEAARERTATVLDAMVENRKLDRDTAEQAKANPVVLKPARIAARSGTWFADWVYREAAEIAGSFRGAMRVRTTFVPALQEIAERVVAAALDREGAASGAGQAALVAMRPDGAVLAMVGGRSYEESEYNRAVQAMRQPGSAFKLFVYYAALRNGLSPDDRIEDAPIEIDGWQPENYGERYHGQVTLADAFARSLNAASVRLAQQLGIAEVVAAARDLGIDAPLAETPSLALGASEVTLLDITGAYAAVRAGVAPIEPWGIAGFGGSDQPQLFGMGPPLEQRHPLGPYHEPLVRMLQRVVESGTGRAAALDGFAAGKTGTSQSFRDAWFIGFTEPLVVGVWVGNDDGTPMDEVSGGTLPARIWRQFMAEAQAMVRSAGQVASAGEPAESTEAEEGEALSLAEGEEAASAPGQETAEREAEREQQIPEAEAEPDMAQGDARPQPAAGEPEGRAGAESDAEPESANAGEQQPTSLFQEAREVSQTEEPPPQCNYRTCSRFYRSFRASDCTFQPFGGGPRKLCER